MAEMPAPLDYLKDYASVREARAEIARYFRFYNQERLHQSLDYQTPGNDLPGKSVTSQGPGSGEESGDENLFFKKESGVNTQIWARIH